MSNEEIKFKLKTLLIDMNKEFPLDDFCDLIEKETSGRMTFTNLKELLDKTYPKTNKQERIFLLKQINLNIKTGLIHILDLFEFITINLDKKLVSPIYTFYCTARLIEKMKKISTLEFVYKCGLVLHSEININEFYKAITASLELDDLTSIILFKSLDYNKTGKIRVEDFVFLIDSYRDDVLYEENSQMINQKIQTELVDACAKVKLLLNQNFLTTEEIFKKLSVNNLNYVDYNQLLNFLKSELNKENNFDVEKMIEIILNSVVKNDPQSLQSSNGKVFKDDFENVLKGNMNKRESGTKNNTDINFSIEENSIIEKDNHNLNNKTNIAKIKLNDVQLYWINKYLVLLESINLTDRMAFEASKESKTNLLNLENLKRKLKLMLPVGKISAMDLNSVIEALDVNKKRYLTLSHYEEIVTVVKLGKEATDKRTDKSMFNSNANNSYMNTPVNNKTLYNTLGRGSKSVNYHLLPVKGNHKVVEQLRIEIGKNYNTQVNSKNSSNTNVSTTKSTNKLVNPQVNTNYTNKQDVSSKAVMGNNFIVEKEMQATNLTVDPNANNKNSGNDIDEEIEEKNEALLIETFESFTFNDPQGILPAYVFFDYLRIRLVDGDYFTQKKISQIIRSVDKNMDGLITYYDILEYLLYEYKHRSTKLAFKSMANYIHNECKLKTEEFFVQNGLEANKELNISSTCDILSKLFRFESPIGKKIYEEMRIVFSHKKNKLILSDLIELIDEVKIEHLLKNELSSGKNFTNSISNLNMKEFEEGIRDFVYSLVDSNNYNNQSGKTSTTKQLTIILRENIKCASNLPSQSTMNLQQFKENFIKPLKMDINLGIAVFQLLKNFSHKNEQIITRDDLSMFLESYLDTGEQSSSINNISSADKGGVNELVRRLESSGCSLNFVLDNIPYNSNGAITSCELIKLLNQFYPCTSKSFLKMFLQQSELDKDRLGFIPYVNLQNFLLQLNTDNSHSAESKRISISLLFKLLASNIDQFYANRDVYNEDNRDKANLHSANSSKKALDYFTSLPVTINNPNLVRKQEHQMIMHSLCVNKTIKDEIFDYLCNLTGDLLGYDLLKLCDKIDFYRDQVDFINFNNSLLTAHHGESLDREEIQDIISLISTQLSKNKKSIFDQFLENLKIGDNGNLSIIEICQNLFSSITFLEREKISYLIKSLDNQRSGYIAYKDFHTKLKDHFGTKYIGNLTLTARFIFSQHIQSDFDGVIEDFIMNKFSDDNLKSFSSDAMNTSLTKDNFSNYFLDYFMNDLDLFDHFYTIYREKEGKNKDMISILKFCSYIKDSNKDRIKQEISNEDESELDQEVFHLLNQIEESQIPFKDFFEFLILNKINEIGGYDCEELRKLLMEKFSVTKEDSNKIILMFSIKKSFSEGNDFSTNINSENEIDLIKLTEYVLLNCEKSIIKVEEISTKIKNAIKKYNITLYETFLKRFSMKGNCAISVREIATGFPPIFRLSIFECFVIILHCRNTNVNNSAKFGKNQKKEKNYITIDFIFECLSLKDSFQSKPEKSSSNEIDSSLKLSLVKLNEYLEKTAKSEKDKENLFKNFDSDGNGELSTEEFLRALNSFTDLKLNDSQKISLLKVADKNKDGKIQIKEFFDFLKYVKNEISGNNSNRKLSGNRVDPGANNNNNVKNAFVPKIEIEFNKFKINYENNIRRIDPKSSDKFSNLVFILQEDFFINFNNYDNIEKDFNSIDETQTYFVPENDFNIVLKKRLLRMDNEIIAKFVEFSNNGLSAKEIKKSAEEKLINYRNFLTNLSMFKYIPSNSNAQTKSDSKATVPPPGIVQKQGNKRGIISVPPPNPPKKLISIADQLPAEENLETSNEIEAQKNKNKTNVNISYNNINKMSTNKKITNVLDDEENNKNEVVGNNAGAPDNRQIKPKKSAVPSKQKLITVQPDKYDEFVANDFSQENGENAEDSENLDDSTRNQAKANSSNNKKKLEEQARKELENSKNKKDIKLKEKLKGKDTSTKETPTTTKAKESGKDVSNQKSAANKGLPAKEKKSDTKKAVIEEAHDEDAKNRNEENAIQKKLTAAEKEEIPGNEETNVNTSQISKKPTGNKSKLFGDKKMKKKNTTSIGEIPDDEEEEGRENEDEQNNSKIYARKMSKKDILNKVNNIIKKTTIRKNMLDDPLDEEEDINQNENKKGVSKEIKPSKKKTITEDILPEEENEDDNENSINQKNENKKKFLKVKKKKRMVSGENQLELNEEEKEIISDLKLPTPKELKEKELREKELRELREKKLKDNELKEEELREKELKEKELRDKELREKELKEKELRDKELREKELKEKELKEKELKEKELREKELKEKELKEKELKEKELKEKELKEKEMREKKLKDKELKEKELKAKELKEKEMREKELKDEENNDIDNDTEISKYNVFEKKKLVINKKNHSDLPKEEEEVIAKIPKKKEIIKTNENKDSVYLKMGDCFASKQNNSKGNSTTPMTAENLKDILSKLQNKNYKGYEYTIDKSKDYFKRNGTEPIETILNSENAAMKKCEELWKSIKDGDNFFDNDYGSQPSDNGTRNKFSLYLTGAAPKGGIDPQLIDWYRISEISRDSPAKFIDDGIETNDVMQGALGDCWFISALAVLASKDYLLRGEFDPSMLQDRMIDSEENIMLSSGVYPPIFHAFRRKGIFCFRFYKDFSWRYVVVDDRLPCKKVYSKSQEPKLIYGKCRSESEFWVPLIEKAYAKIHGSYEALISGFIDDGLVDLTGLVARKYLISPDERKTEKKVDELWSTIKANCSVQFEDEVATTKAGQKSKAKLLSLNDTMMGCSIDAKVVESEVVYHNHKCGLLAGHAYSILDAFEVPKPNGVKSRKMSRLLRIKNPWGFKEWNGKWNDESEEIEKNKDSITNYLTSKYANTSEKINLNQEDGTFIMSFKDFRNIFGKLFICIDFPPSIIGLRIFDKWTFEQSGGLPINNTEKEFKAFAKNPQYYLKLQKEEGVFISLLQKDGRLTQNKFPYAESTRKACIIIMKALNGKNKIESFNNDLTIEITPIRQHREISIYKILPPGEYIIVPAVMREGDLGDFCIEIFLADKIDNQAKNISNSACGMLSINQFEKLGSPVQSELITDFRADQLEDVKKMKEQFIYAHMLDILKDSDDAQYTDPKNQKQNDKKGKQQSVDADDDFDEY